MPDTLSDGRKGFHQLAAHVFEDSHLGSRVNSPVLPTTRTIHVVCVYNVFGLNNDPSRGTDKGPIRALEDRSSVVKLDPNRVLVEPSKPLPFTLASMPRYCIERYKLVDSSFSTNDQMSTSFGRG